MEAFNHEWTYMKIHQGIDRSIVNKISTMIGSDGIVNNGFQILGIEISGVLHTIERPVIR